MIYTVDRTRRTIFALMLIVAGALLFLDNLGVLPIQHLGAYWPILLVVYGVTVIGCRRSREAMVWSIAMIASGILLTLGNLGILRVGIADLWPLLLIALGALMLIHRSRMPPPDFTRFRHRYQRSEMGSSSRSYILGSTLSEDAVFSGVNRRVESQTFEGGKLDAVFGSIEVDLTGAAITSPDRRAEIEANAVFGGIEITVPRTWRVLMKGTGVFGACEDKTVPPRAEAGLEAVTLVITGGAVFGSVTVQN